MGTNRRYAAHFDRLMDERIIQRVADTAGPLQTLSSEELELEREPFTRDPQPKPVRAWVRFGDTPVLVDAEACSWTRHAAAIRFTVAGREYKTWVWASAVREAPQRPSP
ncbi:MULTISPECIES: hypothetical protein [Microbacterium]|uniref:Uncharacterized protein n=1 Tax=Microbacterium wangchenii TaxID=2541726 RepID=A0ABX5SV45_9MICO|nr:MULTISPECIES: hypothetical protein [Microbacterium]MCK6065742.1 hypothetical protein [Microbacterium sp. EYE_512]QBR90060.1 hypothetical protein E4K62_16045 [Microbacterium wangchenii]